MIAPQGRAKYTLHAIASRFIENVISATTREYDICNRFKNETIVALPMLAYHWIFCQKAPF